LKRRCHPYFLLKISHLSIRWEYSKIFSFVVLSTSLRWKAMISSVVKNSLLATLFPRYRARLIEQASGEVARGCRAELWRHVGQASLGMSTPELRGYARAYAAIVALAQVDQVLARRSLKPSLRDSVLASSIDQLVGMAIRDALSEFVPAAAKPLAA
jgi:hypothetical protein